MLIDIIWNQETTQVDLADGTITVGGGTRDHIRVDGLPHGLLSLTLMGQQLSVTAQRSVRIGASLFPARIPRLVVADEELRLPNDVIIRRVVDVKKRESRKTIDTAFVAEQLLSGTDVPVQDTRAASFTCVTGLDQGVVYAIPFNENSIGRADDAVIRVRDRAVSRQQAKLLKRGKDFVLEPVSGSMNGVFVNGRLVKKSAMLRTGDTVEVGQTVLRFDAAERAPQEMTAVAQPSAMPARPVAMPVVNEPSVSVKVQGELVAAPDSTVELPPRRRIPMELLMMGAGVGLTLVGMGIAAIFMRL
ncbi:MAG: FHA domain-containing protein [Archangium sp.]